MLERFKITKIEKIPKVRSFTFGNVTLTSDEMDKTVKNIENILKGKSTIDYYGTNVIYGDLFGIVALLQKVNVNYLDSSLDPTEIGEYMVSNTLVVSGLPEEIIQELPRDLEGKKIIVGSICYEHKNRLHR